MLHFPSHILSKKNLLFLSLLLVALNLALYSYYLQFPHSKDLELASSITEISHNNSIDNSIISRSLAKDYTESDNRKIQTFLESSNGNIVIQPSEKNVYLMELETSHESLSIREANDSFYLLESYVDTQKDNYFRNITLDLPINHSQQLNITTYQTTTSGDLSQISNLDLSLNSQKDATSLVVPLNSSISLSLKNSTFNLTIPNEADVRVYSSEPIDLPGFYKKSPTMYENFLEEPISNSAIITITVHEISDSTITIE